MTLPSVVRPAGTSYWAKSRAPRYSLVLVIPLFLLYEALAAGLGGDPQVANVRNAADVLLKTPFLLAGPRGSMAFFATVVAICVFCIARDLTKSKKRLEPRVFLLMMGESALLALLLGAVVGSLTARLLGGLAALSAVQGGAAALESMSWSARLMLSLGAGLYEELLFRVLLVGGMAFLLRRMLGSAPIAGVIAAVVGALLFSLFHYVGAYGDPFELTSFTYRAIAGLVFSGLYLVRGFGITAWTHALYDVYVLIIWA